VSQKIAGRKPATPSERLRRGLFEQRRKLAVGLVRCEREMTRGLLARVDNAGETTMQLTAATVVEVDEAGGSEQRVLETDPLSLQPDDACLARLFELKLGVPAGRALEHRHTRRSQQRSHDDDFLHVLGQRGNAPLKELVESACHRKLAPLTDAPMLFERPGDFEREERVSSRRLKHTLQKRASEGHAQRLAQQSMQSAKAQRAKTKLRQLPALERSIQPERHPSCLTTSQREQKTDAFLAQPPNRELEHRRRRRVQPLHIVDRDDERPGNGQAAQRRQEAGGDSTLINAPIARIRKQDRHLERTPLRLGQLRQRHLKRI